MIHAAFDDLPPLIAPHVGRPAQGVCLRADGAVKTSAKVMSHRAFDCSTSIAAIVAVTDLEHERDVEGTFLSVAQSPYLTARSPAMPSTDDLTLVDHADAQRRQPMLHPGTGLASG